MPPTSSPEYSQWSTFYSDMARDAFKTNKSRRVYDEVRFRVIDNNSESWLINHNLYPDGSQSCWLRAILRKHRKSFSYLEHIIVLEALLADSWKIADVLKEVISISKKIQPRTNFADCHNKYSIDEIEVRRNQWASLIKRYGVKGARSLGNEAIYSWLYRNDHDWLMEANKQFRIKKSFTKNRVNWRNRDLRIIKKLVKIHSDSLKQDECPRRSINWYILRMLHSSTIAKNIDKLPLTKSFLQRNCESVSDYQIRRIDKAIKKLKEKDSILLKWRVFRMAGLSEERLQERAKKYLERIFKEDG